MRACLCQIGTLHLAFPAQAVRALLPLSSLVSVPGAYEPLLGALVWQGVLVPVVRWPPGEHSSPSLGESAGLLLLEDHDRVAAIPLERCEGIQEANIPSTGSEDLVALERVWKLCSVTQMLGVMERTLLEGFRPLLAEAPIPAPMTKLDPR